MRIVYLDNSATTKTDEVVIKEMLPYLTENYGNPSSIYKIGRENKKAVEEAREKVAKVLNCEPSEIYFTAGGSESDNTAIRGIAYSYKNKGNHIITSKIEHPAVLETCKQLEKEGFEVSYIGVNENCKEFLVSDVNLLICDKIKEKMQVEVKTRYSSNAYKANIIQDGKNIKVVFKESQKAITSGQSAVFYDEDIVIGGGKISKFQVI